jgi:hypothetical protein
MSVWGENLEIKIECSFSFVIERFELRVYELKEIYLRDCQVRS